MVLPIGFFMPLPLPIMIPFMMWQSAAIAAGFGTMFQYTKRRISAMSNDEFNRVDPIALINQDLDNIITNIPSSFTKVQHLNSAVFKAMSDMLADAIQFLTQYISGGGPALTTESTTTTSPQGALIPGVPGFLTPAISLAQQEEARRLAEASPPVFAPPPPAVDPFIGPPAPALTQEQLFQKYKNDFITYRSKGGLLTQVQFNARNTSATSVRQYLQSKHPLPNGATTTLPKNSRRGSASVKIEIQNKQSQITARTQKLDSYFAQNINIIPPPIWVTGLWTSRNKMILSLYNLWWLYQGYDSPRQT